MLEEREKSIVDLLAVEISHDRFGNPDMLMYEGFHLKVGRMEQLTEYPHRKVPDSSVVVREESLKMRRVH
jgi:hypothetical protein